MDVTGLASAAASGGGSFLLTAPAPREVYTPEDFSAEHRLAARSLAAFLDAEVDKRAAELETHNFPLMRRLLRQLGELGFLGVDIPSEYGGGGLDFITSLVVAETMSRGSFAVSFGAHSVIGSLPIVYFGTDEQKRRYLPKFASGDLIAAYALTEPTAGSDALSARTRAVPSADGREYRLTGTKQFITNAGFADVFTTYAKIDGGRFTSFIVDRAAEGLEIGPEEHKMGIKGSSTASLFFENARVPASNVLGEIGGGHKVALNILNMGRLKLATACVGAGKRSLRQAVAYAKERQQFGRPIASFGLIQQKIGEIAVRLYLLESMIYRTGGLIQAARDAGQSEWKAAEEYAVECAISKVYGSEAAGLIVDEVVQIFGGYGFIEEYPAARGYRDARISRIYEGTNEINRLLITGMLLRRAQRGRLPLLAAFKDAAADLPAAGVPAGGGAASGNGPGAGGGPLAAEQQQVDSAKRACLFVAGLAARKYGEALADQQEVMAGIADIVIEIFAMESGLLRARRAAERGGTSETMVDLVRAAVADGLFRVEGCGRRALAAIEEGEGLRDRLAALRRLLPEAQVDGFALRRQIAGRVLDAGAYVV